MPLTIPPAAPSTLDTANFAKRMDERIAWQALNINEMNAALPIVDAAIISTAASSASAAASLIAATSATGVALWASGTYAANACAISALDYQTYRNKTAGARPTDPKNDSSNWVKVGTLASATGNAGRVLTNNGTAESWGPYVGVKATAITAASTLNFSAAAGDYAHISGAATVTAITLASGVEFTTVFEDSVTLTHGGTLFLPGAINIVTSPGDVARWVGDGALVRMIGFQRFSSLPVPAPYIKVSDQKANNTDGGTSVASDITQTRTLNTVEANSISGASLASNTLTLPAGTYQFRIRVPAYGVADSKATLYNVTDSTYVGIGSLGTNGQSNAGTDSWICGQFTISSGKNFKIRHFTAIGVASGLGRAYGIGWIEVFTEAEFWKVG